MTKVTIGYIVGSISSTSINRALADALVKLAPENVEFVEIAIDKLPFYSPDFDADYPAVAREFKDAIAAADGVIFVTPEYSRSIPGVLKNAIDWSSRPWGQNSFTGTPTAVMGTSVGPVGAAVAQQHLKTILTHFASPQLGQPEGFIQSLPGLFTEDGDVTNEATAEFLRGFLAAFAHHIARVQAADAVAA